MSEAVRQPLTFAVALIGLQPIGQRGGTAQAPKGAVRHGQGGSRMGSGSFLSSLAKQLNRPQCVPGSPMLSLAPVGKSRLRLSNGSAAPSSARLSGRGRPGVRQVEAGEPEMRLVRGHSLFLRTQMRPAARRAQSKPDQRDSPCSAAWKRPCRTSTPRRSIWPGAPGRRTRAGRRLSRSPQPRQH
jgi:hypothetical protein